MENTETIMICDCGSVEHQLLFIHEHDDNEVHMMTYLHKWSFWRRLIVAIKYLFGYHCRYGHWDTFTFKKEHAVKLREIANTLDPSSKRNGLFSKETYDDFNFPVHPATCGGGLKGENFRTKCERTNGISEGIMEVKDGWFQCPCGEFKQCKVTEP